MPGITAAIRSLPIPWIALHQTHNPLVLGSSPSGSIFFHPTLSHLHLRRREESSPRQPSRIARVAPPRSYSSDRLISERIFFSIISPRSSNFERRVVREMPKSLLACAWLPLT